MPTYVALLRGINVGGHHRIAMKDLINMFTESGCEDVRSYIQSGNVVFSASAAIARRIPKAIPSAIEAALGFSPSTIVFGSEEFRSIVNQGPYAKLGETDKSVNIGFLADKPAGTAGRELKKNLEPGEEFKIGGRGIHLRLPLGVAKSGLTINALESALGVTCTVRNWRTSCKLHDMLEQ